MTRVNPISEVTYRRNLANRQIKTQFKHSALNRKLVKGEIGCSKGCLMAMGAILLFPFMYIIGKLALGSAAGAAHKDIIRLELLNNHNINQKKNKKYTKKICANLDKYTLNPKDADFVREGLNFIKNEKGHNIYKYDLTRGTHILNDEAYHVLVTMKAALCRAYGYASPYDAELDNMIRESREIMKKLS